MLVELPVVVHPNLSATLIREIPIMFPSNGCNSLHLLTLQNLVVVVEADVTEFHKIRRGCVVQDKFIRLNGCHDITHGHGCRCLIAVK